MFVCERCHDRDERVTKCKTLFEHHSVHVSCPCDICGKADILAKCWAYDYLKGSEGAKCSCAKNVMNGIDE